MSAKTKKVSEVPVQEHSSLLGLAPDGTMVKMDISDFAGLVIKEAFSHPQPAASPEDITSAGIWSISRPDRLLPDGPPCNTAG